MVRRDYTATDSELGQLQAAASNPWKEFFLVAVSLGVPCVINAAAIWSSQEHFIATAPIFLNSVVGLVCLATAAICGVMWKRSRFSLESLVTAIKQKPQTEIVFDRGQLHARTLSAAQTPVLQQPGGQTPPAAPAAPPAASPAPAAPQPPATAGPSAPSF